MTMSDMELVRRMQELQQENEMLLATVERLEREKSEFEAIGRKENDECKWWKDQCESMEIEYVKMRAQLDIVYLIFGGKQ